MMCRLCPEQLPSKKYLKSFLTQKQNSAEACEVVDKLILGLIYLFLWKFLATFPEEIVTWQILCCLHPVLA